MEIAEDTFWDEYEPVKNHLDDNASYDGAMFETFGDELKYVFKLAGETNCVWTIADGDDGIIIQAGFHYVNRIGYLVTKKPFTSEDDFVNEDF